MRKSDRLRALQMCVARHYDVSVSLRDAEQSSLQTSQTI
jgi:hypothetical protein